ncbi:hypothetical protein HGM15179_009816 [Zosterops borbonicus]|uniref:RNA-directed DNA polymerase n=1 Tax=Zosterops borbonicus TaxID=364589 RepID=A0A8K1LKT7_9PASS|nr:hypothetical protein HGM15179_009816 [Zosterops borbonicus]
MEHLVGEGDWEGAPEQAEGIPQEVLEVIKEKSQQAFVEMRPAGPLTPFSEIFQGPTETFVAFVECLAAAIEQQVPRSYAREEVLEQMVYTHANDKCTNAILSILKPPGEYPTLQEMLRAVSAMVPIHKPGSLLDKKKTHPRVAAAEAPKTPNPQRKPRGQIVAQQIPNPLLDSVDIGAAEVDAEEDGARDDCAEDAPTVNTVRKIVHAATHQAIIHHYMDEYGAPSDNLLAHALDLTVASLVAAGFELQESKIQKMPPWKYLGLEMGWQTIVPQKLAIKTEIKTLADVHQLCGALNWQRTSSPQVPGEDLPDMTSGCPLRNLSPDESDPDLSAWFTGQSLTTTSKEVPFHIRLVKALWIHDRDWHFAAVSKNRGTWHMIGTTWVVVGDCKHTPPEIEIVPQTTPSDPEWFELWLRCTNPPIYLSQGQIIAQAIPLLPERECPEGDCKTCHPLVSVLMTITQDRPEEVCKLRVGEETTTIKGLLDTGADVTVIPEHLWPSRWPLQTVVEQVEAAHQAIIYHYMDDVLVCAPNDDLLTHALDLTVAALVAAGFELQETKIQKMPPWKYLGLEISNLPHLHGMIFQWDNEVTNLPRKDQGGRDPLLIIEWVFLSHHRSKRMTRPQELMAELIRKARVRIRELAGCDFGVIHIPILLSTGQISKAMLEHLLQEIEALQFALDNYTGQISIHRPAHKIFNSDAQFRLKSVQSVVSRAENSVLQEVSNIALFELLSKLIKLISHREQPFYVMHPRSHTDLPGFIVEGNRRADTLAAPVTVAPLPDIYQQAKLSHQLFHQNVPGLVRGFKQTRDQAKAIVATCPSCQWHAVPTMHAGVNPRGLCSNEVWQMDVTHVSQFGRLKYVHVSVDTFSGAVYASAHTGEKTGDVIKHLLQAFSFLGIPKVIKTDNGPGYVSKELCNFLQQWGIEHKTGIPYSATGQAIVERTHQNIKRVLEQQGQILKLEPPQIRLARALYTLNFLNCSFEVMNPPIIRHFGGSPNLKPKEKTPVLVKDPETLRTEGPHDLITWGCRYACVSTPTGLKWVPAKWVRPYVPKASKGSEHQAESEPQELELLGSSPAPNCVQFVFTPPKKQEKLFTNLLQIKEAYHATPWCRQVSHVKMASTLGMVPLSLPKGVFLICGDRAFPGIPSQLTGGPCTLGKLGLLAPNKTKIMDWIVKNSSQHATVKKRDLADLDPDCKSDVIHWSKAKATAITVFLPWVSVAKSLGELGQLKCWVAKQANLTSTALSDLLRDEEITRQATLQNRAAIDYLLLLHHHTCEEFEGLCCFNLSSKAENVRQSIRKIQDMVHEIKQESRDWFDNLFGHWGLSGWVGSAVKTGLLILLFMFLVGVAFGVIKKFTQRAITNATSALSVNHVWATAPPLEEIEMQNLPPLQEEEENFQDPEDFKPGSERQWPLPYEEWPVNQTWFQELYPESDFLPTPPQFRSFSKMNLFGSFQKKK